MPATKKKTARIGSKHPVRNAVASLPNYFPRPIDAIVAIEQILTEHGFDLDNQTVLNLSGKQWEQVSFTIPIVPLRENGVVCSGCDCPVEIDNCIAFSYYKLLSGTYEITVYVSI